MVYGENKVAVLEKGGKKSPSITSFAQWSVLLPSYMIGRTSLYDLKTWRVEKVPPNE